MNIFQFTALSIRKEDFFSKLKSCSNNEIERDRDFESVLGRAIDEHKEEQRVSGLL